MLDLISFTLLADEMHGKNLLVERLIVVALQSIGCRQISKFVSRARVIRLPQLNKDVEVIVAAMPLGTRHVDRARVEVGGLEATVGLGIANLDDVAAVGTQPSAPKKLFADWTSYHAVGRRRV